MNLWNQILVISYFLSKLLRLSIKFTKIICFINLRIFILNKYLIYVYSLSSEVKLLVIKITQTEKEIKTSISDIQNTEL